MVVMMELKEIFENPTSVKKHLRQGDEVRVFNHGDYLFDAVKSPWDRLVTSDDFEDNLSTETEAYLAREIVATEQLEREGKVKYLTSDEFWAALESREAPRCLR